MLELNLNFEKKDVEVKINGKVYGFDLNNEKLEQMKILKEVADKLNYNDEEEVIIALEDGLELIYGEGIINSIYGENETTRATLLEILLLTIDAINDYGSTFGIKHEDEKIVALNRQQRRMQRANRKR